MKLKTLTILCFLFCLNLTENSVSAGGPSPPSPPSPSSSNKDKLCPSECLRNGQKLTSKNGKFSLVITEGGAILVINNETGQITNRIYVGSFPCPVEICIDPNGKLKVTACGVIIYERQFPPGSCLQITDDGRVIIVDKDGNEIMEVFRDPINPIIGK
jgi:hypothetical protein